MLLQHNNAISHTSAATTMVKENITFKFVPHPSYNPDLVLFDFWLFVALMEHLKGIHFTCDADVQAARGKWFQEEPEEFYSYRFEKPVHCWQLGIDREADYLEK
jgi:hypothetical protein